MQYKLPFYVNKYNAVQVSSRDHCRVHSSHDRRSVHCCMSAGMEQVHSRGQSTVITVDIFKSGITFCADQGIVAGHGSHGRHF